MLLIRAVAVAAVVATRAQGHDDVTGHAARARHALFARAFEAHDKLGAPYKYNYSCLYLTSALLIIIVSMAYTIFLQPRQFWPNTHPITRSRH